MIEPKEAIASIMLHSTERSTIKMNLNSAHNHVLATDVVSGIDMPPFDQSAMDGYAIKAPGQSQYKVVGEIKAGDDYKKEINDGEAIRVFTGAMIPGGTHSVVKQEDTITEGNSIIISTSCNKNSNIRQRGEQIKSKSTAIRAGTYLNAGTVGFLASLGVREVEVYHRPTVSIVTTGSELVAPGTQLQPGQIFESNSIMLQSALRNEHLDCTIHKVKDNIDQTIDVLRLAVESSDIVLITGGISAGDYDFVAESLAAIGVTKIFHKVAQKPGKPLFFGKKGKCLVFGLPGNPGAALSCFYLYAIPAIRQMQLRKDKELTHSRARITEEYIKSNDLTHFLKGQLKKGSVHVLPKQSSAMLGDFAQANCIIVLDGEANIWQKGDFVDIIILPD